MVVTAHYTDGTTADLTENDYTIFHGDQLTQGQTYVTIQYNDGSGNSGIKVDQKITVGAYEGPHTHTYGGPWYADAMSHWHQCTDSACPDPSGSTKDLASHTFVWKVDKAATETQTGLKHEECTVCSYKRSENTVIDKLPDDGSANPGGNTGSTDGSANPGGNTGSTDSSANPGGNTGSTDSSDNNANKPAKEDSVKSPQTGDTRTLGLWIVLLFVSGGVLTVLGLNGKKRKESEAE